MTMPLRSPLAPVAFALATGSILFGCSEPDASGPSDRDIAQVACDRYLDCLSATNPGEVGSQVAAYGREGSCWEGGNDTVALCQKACIEATRALEQTSNALECRPCANDAHCAPYGDDLHCDPAGECVQCVTDQHCSGYTPRCNVADGVCAECTDPENGQCGGGDTPVPTPTPGGDPPAAVDILFVIDNSGSMGEEQQNLASSLTGFLPVFEASSIDVRVAITTTDNGNLWCRGAGVSDPEAGQLVASSCQARLNDFLFAGDGTDASSACTDNCSLPTLPNLPNPWFEGSTLTPENLRCALPQGINGCGFESTLESLWKSLQLIEDPNQNQFGFVRDDAHLMVVVLSDEADCSFNAAHEQAIFGAEGDRTFWSLPDVQMAPTSAVCWNAGVLCQGDPSGYTSCLPQDKNAQGGSAGGADDAVLWPVEKYAAMLASQRVKKQTFGAEVFVFGLLGVPTDYPATGSVTYAMGANANDPNSFQARFGIGQGCASADGEAVPPVRLRALIETAGSGAIYSICSSGFETALTDMAERVVAFGRE